MGPKTHIPRTQDSRVQIPRAQFSIEVAVPSDSVVIEGVHKKDLKLRTFRFAREVRKFVNKVPRTTGNLGDCRQLVRSSGSVGANYLEANNALSQKDALMRIRICLKESRESGYWLRLLDLSKNPQLAVSCKQLIQESSELAKIFATISRKLDR